MKELFYTLEFQKETAPVDSMAIIGDEGEDVTALIAANQNQKQSQNRLNPKIKKLQPPEATKEKNNI
jgi:hypothetical protein